MIKIIGISGSPRKGGNSETLLDEALDGARSAGASCEKIRLNDLNYKACQECGGCKATGKCIIEDDMRPIYRKADEADGIIIASPIFFGSVTAQLKTMIDRFQCYWVKKYVLKEPPSPKKKKGVFLCISGSDRKEFFENAKKIVKIFFATLNVEYLGDLFCPTTENMDEIKRDKDTLVRAFELGETLVNKLRNKKD